MWCVGGLVWLLSLWLEGVVFAYGSLGGRVSVVKSPETAGPCVFRSL